MQGVEKLEIFLMTEKWLCPLALERHSQVLFFWCVFHDSLGTFALLAWGFHFTAKSLSSLLP